MFIVTEAMGAVVAKIAKEAGFPPSGITFEEGRLTVTFETTKAVKAVPARKSPQVTADLPEGPWEKVTVPGQKKVMKWTCQGVTATVTDLASNFNVHKKTMKARLERTGMACTTLRRSKTDLKNKRKNRIAV
jgi:hypothetical protein